MKPGRVASFIRSMGDDGARVAQALLPGEGAAGGECVSGAPSREEPPANGERAAAAAVRTPGPAAAVGDPAALRALLEQGFPTLDALVRSAQGEVALAELSRLLRRALPRRAPRFQRNLVAQLHVQGQLLSEVGVIRDLSATGSRVSFQRNASLDAIQGAGIELEIRAPGGDRVRVPVELVRIAEQREMEVQLAFRFLEPQRGEDFAHLLASLAAFEAA